MSQWSQVRQSRHPGKHKATQRAEHERSLRTQLSRVTTERARATTALTEAQAHRRPLETQSRGLVVPPQVARVFWALQVVCVARIGFRAGARVLSLLAEALGRTKAPCPHTRINGVTRLSIVRSQAARMLQGVALSQAPFSNGLIWMIDVSIALGAGKMVAVVALDAPHHHRTQVAPGLQQVRCLAVSVAASWTGDTLADWLKRLLVVMGRPAAYLQDGGSDRHTAIDVWAAQGLARPAMDAMAHAVAQMLKRRAHQPPHCATFLSACGRLSGKLTHTLLACLAPATVHTKARCMHVPRLVTWADRLLTLAPAGGAQAGSTLATWRAGLDAFPSCKALSTRLRDDAVPLLACQQRLHTQGLSHTTLAPCAPLLDAIASAPVRRECAGSRQDQLQTATALGLDNVGLPSSAEPIASLCGLAKPHGVGERKDAHRIALRLPALCGAPTQEEAKQVLAISVAEQHEITGRFTALSQQRREVLPNPDALARLSMEQTGIHVDLIPTAKNRSTHQKTVPLSISYKESYGPELHRQDAHRCPESAVS